MTVFNIVIKVDAKNAVTGTNKVDKSLNSLKKTADHTRVSMGRMLAVMLAFSGARRTVRLLADFEQSISTVRAVTGATADSMARLTAEAERLGVTTRFSAVDAADGMVLLARAGFTVDETLSAVGDTLLLAQAGALELAQASEITADTLRAFGIEAANTSRVTDVLAKASNSSNTTVIQLGQALKFVAPIARGLGVSLEETSAALAVLANSGQKASIGGTGLRRVMAALESPTAKAMKVLAALGLSAEDVRVSSVGLTGAMENMARAGVTTSEIFQIFGRRSGTAAQILLANVGAVNKMDEALQDAAGTAKTMAKIMDDNLNGSLFRARSATQGLGVALGRSGLSTTLVILIDTVAASFRFLADSAAALAPILAGLSAVIVASMVPAIVSLIAKMGLLNSAIALNPYVLSGAVIIAAITAVAGAYATLNAEISAVNKVIDAEAKLSSSGFKLLAIRKQIKEVKKQEMAGWTKEEGLLESLLAKEKALEVQLFKKNIQTQLNLEAQAALVPTIDNIIARIDRQVTSLGTLTDAEKISAEVSADLARIRQNNVDVEVSQGDKDRLRIKQEELALAKRMAKVVAKIRGPYLEAVQTAKDLDTALKLGNISLREYSNAMDSVSEAVGRISRNDPFRMQVESIRKGNEELRLRTTYYGLELQFRLQLLALGKKAEDLSGKDLQDLTSALALQQQMLALQKKMSAEAAKVGQGADRKKAEAEEAAARQKFLLRRADLTGQLAVKRADLLALEERGAITTKQLALAMEELQLRGLEASTTLGDGFERAFIKMRREANDFAAVSEGVMNAFADNSTDALVKFAETGKFAFKDFAASILKDITRIIARLLVMQAISAAAGGLGIPGASPGVLPARADGGPVQAGRSYLVGEKGPEILQTNKPGTIIPNGAAAAGEPPVVNVSVTNVTDPNEVQEAISDGGADEAIINVLSRNADKIKGMF